MKPEIEKLISGYLFKWADVKLSISVSHIRLHSSDGRITGELLITSSIVGDKPIFPSTMMNFTSERTRSSLIKNLMGTYSQWDWQSIIDQLCQGIIDGVRCGEPLSELWTHADISAPEFILEPILYKGLPSLIYGDKATCKSTMALVIYAALLLPWHDNPLGWKMPNRPIGAILLDFESNAEIAHWNSKKLQQGMGFPNYPLYHLDCRLPLVDDIERIQYYVQQKKAEVVIVDSLAPAIGGDIKEPGPALAFNQAIRGLRSSVLIIGQEPKFGEEGKKKRTFGSVLFEYFARHIFRIAKVQEEGQEIVDIALLQTYSNLGKKLPPLGYRLTFGEDTIRIARTAIISPELVREMGAQVRILELLKLGAMMATDIAEALDITQANAYVSLKRLKDRGKVIKVGDKWGRALQ